MISPGQEALDHRLTHRDLEHTPDDGNRYEIIDGVIHVTPFPTYAHQRVMGQLFAKLFNHVHDGALGEVLSAGLKVVLDEPTGVGPDIVYISAARMGEMRPDGYYGAPDLLVEVLSSKPMLDRYVKLHKYASAGVPHYWIVDPEKKCLSAYRLDGDRYRLVAELFGESVFAPELFPELSITLADLWV